MLDRRRPWLTLLHYRWQHARTLSILHRVTGIILSGAFLGFTCWVMAVAQGPAAYAQFMGLLAHPFFKAAFALMLASVAYHVCNGIRHILWDAVAGVGGFARGWRRGSIRHGAKPWWAQRVAALALLPLGAWFCVAGLAIPTTDYPGVRAWVTRGWNAPLLLALILAAARHSYLGLRVIVEDYADDFGLRIPMLLMIRFVFVLSAGGAALAVFAVARP